MQHSRRSALGMLGAASIATGVGLAAPGAAYAGSESHHTGSGRVPRDLLPGGAYERYLAQLAAQDQFSGTVLVAHRGRPVLTRSFGMADKLNSLPNRADTIFTLASLGKVFTGVAAGQLAAQGKLDFSATVGTYLDGFPANIANTVTLHQMFTHTSGLGNYQNTPAWQTESKLWLTPEAEFDGTMAVIRQSPLLSAPGTGYSYSNSAYYVLGAIIARVSGLSFWDYVRKHIFGPAKMSSTDYYPNSRWQTDARFAHAYGPAGPDGQRADTTMQKKGIGIGGGAGGGFSTAPDLLRFAIALNNGTLLDPAYASLITGGKHPISPAQHNPNQPPSQNLLIAYGFEDRMVNNQHIIGRGGASPMPGGISTNLSTYPGLGWVAILLSNYFINLVPILELQADIVTKSSTGS